MGYMYEGSYYGDDDTHDEYGGSVSDLIDELRDVINDGSELDDDFQGWLDDISGSDLFWRFWSDGDDCDDIIEDYLSSKLDGVAYGDDPFMGAVWVDDHEGER